MFYDEPANYKGYLPEIYRDTVEVDALNGTINIELYRLAERVKRIAENTIPHLSDADGTARWEKVLGLSSPMNSSLESRREAVRAKLMSKPPINLETLRGIVEAYMGLSVEMSMDGYTIRIRYRGTSRIADLEPLKATAYELIPANMLLDIAYAYLAWAELDGQALTFAELDTKELSFDDFERGMWIGLH